jgi:hypothetical protein
MQPSAASVSAVHAARALQLASPSMKRCSWQWRAPWPGSWRRLRLQRARSSRTWVTGPASWRNRRGSGSRLPCSSGAPSAWCLRPRETTGSGAVGGDEESSTRRPAGSPRPGGFPRFFMDALLGSGDPAGACGRADAPDGPGRGRAAGPLGGAGTAPGAPGAALKPAPPGTPAAAEGGDDRQPNGGPGLSSAPCTWRHPGADAPAPRHSGTFVPEGEGRAACRPNPPSQQGEGRLTPAFHHR